MNEMEVVGVVAAVPALLTIIKTTVILVRDVSNSKRAVAKATKGLDSQLQALAGALEKIGAKQTPTLVSTGQLEKLGPLIHQLYGQLKELNDIVSAARGHGRLGRMKMLVGGLEKKLKDHLQQLETSISLLNLHLLECTLALSEETALATRLTKMVQVRELLKPCDQDFVPRKLDGTLDWVASHPAICKWRLAADDQARKTDPFSRLLVIHGAKGCGKSVLSATLADAIRSAGVACAAFFFYHGIEKQKRLVSMWCTLLWQLLHLQNAAKDVVGQVCDSLVSSGRVTEDSLLESLDSVMMASLKPTYLIIDGIDESVADWNDDDGPWRVIRTWLAKHPLLYILLVGRKPAFHVVLGAVHQDNIIELSEDITNTDITRFITHRLQSCQNLDDVSDELRLDIRQGLQEKSTGMFLWVDLAFKELRKCYSPAALRDCLDELPRSLDELPRSLDDEYCRLFSQVFGRLSGRTTKPSAQAKAARSLLALIIGAIEPLSVEELRYAYAVLCDDGPGWRDQLISQDAVLDSLGDFISFRSNRVEFSHASVQEFLIRPLDEWTDSPKDVLFFRLDPDECQQMIGNACLRYLHAADFGFSSTEDSYSTLILKPFLSYSLRHGPLHWAQMTSVDPTIFPTVVDKLKVLIAGPHFTGIVGFFLSGLQHDVDFAQDYGLSLMTLGRVFGDELIQPFLERMEGETGRSRDSLATEVGETAFWDALTSKRGISDIVYLFYAALFRAVRPNHRTECEPRPHTPPKSSCAPDPDQPVIQSKPNWMATAYGLSRQLPPSGHIPTALASSIPSGLRAVAHLPSMSRALHHWLDPRDIRRQVMAAMTEKLPVLVLVCLAATLYERGDKQGSLELLRVAVKRTSGQKNAQRVAALWCYSLALPEEVTYDVERESHFAEVSALLSSRPDSPIAKMLKQHLVHQRIATLSSLGSVAEVERLVDELLELHNQQEPQGTWTALRKSSLLTSVLYRRSWWIKAENKLLIWTATGLNRHDLMPAAYRIWQHLVERQRKVLEPHHAEILYRQYCAGDALFASDKLAEAEQYFTAVLKEHAGVLLTDEAQTHLAECSRLLAKSVYFQDRASEALPLFRSARRRWTHEPSGAYEQVSCTWFISRCLQASGDFKAARAELEAVKMDNYVLLFRRGSFREWDDPLLWDDLSDVYSHLKEHEKIVTLRSTIHRLLLKSPKYIKYKTDNLWYLIRALFQTSAYKDAVDTARDLIKLLETTSDRQMPKVRAERKIMEARAELLCASSWLERSPEIETIEKDTLRDCLEDLNRRQAEGGASVRVVLTYMVETWYQAAEAVYGPDHMYTARFHEHLEAYARMDKCWEDDFLAGDEPGVGEDEYSDDDEYSDEDEYSHDEGDDEGLDLQIGEWDDD